MKTIRFTIAALATLALATACTNEDQVTPDGAVHIIASIEPGLGASPTRATIGADGAGTFQNGDTWGLYTTVNSAIVDDNMEYTYGTTLLYWSDLSESDPVTFAAHYPRITGTIADPTAYGFTPWGTFEDDDLLFATDTKSQGGTVNLTFRHLMHRLTINLQNGTGMESADLSGATIWTVDPSNVPTMKGVIPVNLLTGELGVPIDGATHSSIGATFDKIVIPHTLTPGAGWLRINVGADKWYYSVPADLDTTLGGNQTTLESGKHLTLNLTLIKTPTGNQVDMADATITAWDSQGEITGEPTLQ